MLQLYQIFTQEDITIPYENVQSEEQALENIDVLVKFIKTSSQDPELDFDIQSKNQLISYLPFVTNLHQT